MANKLIQKLRQFVAEGNLLMDKGLYTRPGHRKLLRDCEKAGYLESYDAMFGNEYYDFTPKGKKEFISG